MSYEFDGAEGMLVPFVCKADNCGKIFFFGGPYCPEHLRKMYFLEVKSHPTLMSPCIFVCGLGATAKTVYHKGNIIASMPISVKPRQKIVNKYHMDTTERIPYIVRFGEDEYLDGGLKRDMCTLIRPVSKVKEANVKFVSHVQKDKIILYIIALDTIYSGQELTRHGPARASAYLDRHFKHVLPQGQDYNSST